MPGPQASATRPSPTARKARGAVGGLFLVNGMIFASFVPWLPLIKTDLGLSNTAFGSAIAALPLGALVLGTLAGPLIARFGSARVAVAMATAGSAVLPLVALAPNWVALASVLFVIGGLDAWTDSAMNAHALRVQRHYGRSIIVTFHAVWSIGAVGAGLLGAAAAGLGVPMIAHLGTVAVLLVGLSIAAWRFTLAGPEHAERDDGAEAPRPSDVLRGIGRSAWLLLALGVLLMLAGAIEDSAASWGALYARELGASPFLAGLPFVACQAMMTVGRLAGDRLTDAYGPVPVARVGGLLAAIGLGGALLFPSPVTAIIGFGLSGLGISTLFPLGLAAAGSIPGVRSGDGVTIVAWLARVGFLAFPPLVGVLSDAASLGVGLLVIPAASVVVILVAGALRPRDAPA